MMNACFASFKEREGGVIFKNVRRTYNFFNVVVNRGNQIIKS